MAKKNKVRPSKPSRNRYTPKPTKRAKPSSSRGPSRAELMAKIEQLERQVKRQQRIKRGRPAEAPVEYNPPASTRSRSKPVEKKSVSKQAATRASAPKTTKKRFKGKAKLVKERKRIYGQRDRLKAKRDKGKITKKERLRLNKLILAETEKLNDVNRRLGAKTKELPTAGKKTVMAPKQRIRTLIRSVWDAKDQLNDYLQRSFWKSFTIRGTKIPSRYASEVMSAFANMEDDAYSSGRSTPSVTIVENYKTKNISMDIF